MIATTASRYGTTRNKCNEGHDSRGRCCPGDMSYIFGMTPDHWTCALVFAQRLSPFLKNDSYSMSTAPRRTISFPSWNTTLIIWSVTIAHIQNLLKESEDPIIAFMNPPSLRFFNREKDMQASAVVCIRIIRFELDCCSISTTDPDCPWA